MNEKIVKNIPKLRFSEFVNDGEWEVKPLGKYLLKHPDYGVNAAAVPFSEKLPTYLRITDISVDGYYLSNEKVSVDIDATSDNYLEDGDIVLARTGASVGKSYKYRKEDGALVFAGFLIRVKPDKKKLNSDLLFHFLSTEKYWNWVNVISARSGQPGINGNEYASLPIPIPTTLKEQQKIADCLSSIDNLISAQSQKVELLKVHKKGLLQNLFPKEGEDIPKIRFPKFLNDEVWEENFLKEVLIKNSLKNKEGKYLLVQSVSNKHGFINQDEYFENRRVASKDTSNYYVIKKGFFAYNPSRIDVGSLAYKFDDEPSIISPLYVSFRSNKEKIVDIFLLNWFFSENFTNQMIFEGGVRNTLNYENLIQIKIKLPQNLKEQQKIADCLTSIDNEINIQIQKIESLKEHKKALLQQLFPSNEVNK